MNAKERPLITIITVSYNVVKTIEKTIQSIVNQDYKDIEYIIIDGGSTDGTVDIIKKYENRISYWVSEPDKGIYDAMNKGIKQANGEWINFMNAGDVFHDEKVILHIFQCSIPYSVKVVYGSYREKRSDTLSSEISPLDLKCLSYRMAFCHQSSFVRTEQIKMFYFDLSYEICADFALFNNLYKCLGYGAFLKSNYCISIFDITDSISRKMIWITRKELLRIWDIKGFFMWVKMNLLSCR